MRIAVSPTPWTRAGRRGASKTVKLSKTQIDKLGDRLRGGSLVESDLKALDEYRRSFGEAYESVVRAIREQTELEPTGRPAKSTGAIVEKLHRESIRLTQVQDIAGCRVVVGDVAEQDRIVASLRTVFPAASVVDRRATPSHGYRATHVVVESSGRVVEIQVRTSLQHLWAELSEKFADEVDPHIKYGGGPDEIRKLLDSTSNRIAEVEGVEADLLKARNLMDALKDSGKVNEELRAAAETGYTNLVQRIAALKRHLTETLHALIFEMHRFKEQKT